MWCNIHFCQAPHPRWKQPSCEAGSRPTPGAVEEGPLAWKSLGRSMENERSIDTDIDIDLDIDIEYPYLYLYLYLFICVCIYIYIYVCVYVYVYVSENRLQMVDFHKCPDCK